MRDSIQSVVFAAIAVAFLASSTAYADTEVIGNIPFNKTWTKADSPYLLKGDVKVKNQATLTIEPGVEVRFAAN